MSRSQLPTERLQSKPPSSRPNRWRLVVISEEGSSSHALPKTGSVTLGRDDTAEIRLDDISASRRHAALHLGEQVTIQDLGGANGTVVRGRKLEPNESVTLSPGDTIELGKTLVVLQHDELSDRSRPWTLITHAHFVEQIAKATAPFALLRLQVMASPGVAQDVLSVELAATDVVASFGPGQFEVLAHGKTAEEGQRLLEKLSAKLVSAGARVRAGASGAPRDGTTAEELLAACARPAAAPAPGFVVRDDAMAAIYRQLDRIAPSNINVLLLGETGSGKEVLSAEVHRRSKRAAGPFLKLNCTTLTESLLESELFGHEKGSFTGAIKTKPGLLETARGGTVLLDEIGEIPPSIQAKLLRVLEERAVMRVGGLKAEPIDVRFVFATNRDLEAEVARGAFRADLYFRVNGISVAIPPLRDRVAEIEPLARTFAADAAARDGRQPPEFSPEAIAALKAWPWPGNIRELRNTIIRAELLSAEGKITPASLALGKSGGAPAQAAAPGASGTNLRDEREAAEKRAVLEALEKCDGNQTRAAELLGVSRRTLVTRLSQYGLTRARKKDEA
ncbi:MAG: Sigma-54 dependent transcriptional regulator [Myxococcaceae bacterium]|nr:Sigma-54 dependent transcriptional regulator [Myxococcaceae bacterium]